MKNFDQPSVQESLTYQGMILRGRTIRLRQGEGAYIELLNPTREIENREEIPPQPPPLPSRNLSVSTTLSCPKVPLRDNRKKRFTLHLPIL